MSKRKPYTPPPIAGMQWSTLLTEVLTNVAPQLNALRENHYAFDLSILGLTSMPTPDGLRAAWHATALRTHPQHGGTDEAFVRAKAAYDRLVPVVKVVEARKAAEALRAAVAASRAPSAAPVTVAPDVPPTANVDEAPVVTVARAEPTATKRWELSDNATQAIILCGFMVMLAFMVYVLAQAAR